MLSLFRNKKKSYVVLYPSVCVSPPNNTVWSFMNCAVMLSIAKITYSITDRWLNEYGVLVEC